MALGGQLIPGSGYWQQAFCVIACRGHLLFILDSQYTLLLFPVTSLELFGGSFLLPVMYTVLVNTGILPSSGQSNPLLELQIRLNHGQELRQPCGRLDSKASTQPLFLMLDPALLRFLGCSHSPRPLDTSLGSCSAKGDCGPFCYKEQTWNEVVIFPQPCKGREPNSSYVPLSFRFLREYR